MQIRAASDQPEYSWAYTPNLPRYDFDQRRRARSSTPRAGASARTVIGRRTEASCNSSRRTSPDRRTGTPSSSCCSATGATSVSTWRSRTTSLRCSSRRTAPAASSRPASSTWRWTRGTTARIPTTRPSSCATRCRRAGKTSTISATRLDTAEQVALNSYDIGVRKRAYAAIQYRLVDREPLMVLWFARRIDRSTPTSRLPPGAHGHRPLELVGMVDLTRCRRRAG